MNAPAALLVAKMLIPETMAVDQRLQVNRQEIGRNPIDALANGTTEGLKLALNVAAMLISFYAFILLINYFLSFIGSFSFFTESNLNENLSLATEGRFNELSLQAIFGFLFAPVAWLIGVSSSEVLEVGQLIGTKLFATEFFAFADLSTLQANGMSERSVYLGNLCTMWLCQFYVDRHSNWGYWSVGSWQKN